MTNTEEISQRCQHTGTIKIIPGHTNQDLTVIIRIIDFPVNAFRIFHSGMATPVPVANGGTGASSAKAALSNLGIFYAATLPSTGTDGQICLVPV